MRPRRLQSATILSMVTGPAIGPSRLPTTEVAALYAPSCKSNVTIRSQAGYGGRDGWNGVAPDLPSRRLDRLARRQGLAARRSRRSQAAPQRLGLPLLALLY